MTTTPKRSLIQSKTKPKASGSSSSAIAAKAIQPESTEQSVRAVLPRIPSNVPSIYADQIVDVVYGAHTTKLVLGVENGAGIQAVGVVVLPTAALLASVVTMKDNLTSSGMVEELSSRYASFLIRMRQDSMPAPKNPSAKKNHS